MARPMRVKLPNGWYHVMNDGRRGENIFLENDDQACFISVLKESAKIYNIEVAAFCLMLGHYQLLLKTPKANLPLFMRHLSSIYTQTFNRKYGYSGSFFNGRYRSVLIRGGEHLLEVMKYLHRYPKISGLVEHIDNYPWTSHKDYLSKRPENDWLHIEGILRLLANEKSTGKKQYNEYLEKDNKEEIIQFFTGKRAAVLGEQDCFSEPLDSSASDVYIPVEKITEKICDQFQIPRELLFQSKRGKENFVRDTTIYLTRIHSNDSLSVIGNHFGLSSPSSVSTAIKRVMEKMENDEETKKLIDGIESELSTDL